MPKPKITITIDGPTGAGKTTLAQYIGANLRHQHGVKVVLHDDGNYAEALTQTDLPNHFDADVTINVEQK
jgi:uridine kinase